MGLWKGVFIIAQKFDNVKFVMRRILDGSEELAEAILRKHGDFLTVPATNRVTLKEMARYFGVDEQYLRMVLNNHKITAKHEKKHVLKGGAMFFKQQFPKMVVKETPDCSHYKVSEIEGGQMRHMFLTKGYICLYTMQAFLALVPLIFNSKAIHKQKASEVWEEVLQCQEYTSCPLAFECGNAVVEEVQPTADVAEVTPDSQISVSPEVLQLLVRTVVTESVDAIIGRLFGKSPRIVFP